MAWDSEPTFHEYQDDGTDTALEWDEFLQAYGPEAYVVARYLCSQMRREVDAYGPIQT